MNRSIKFKLKNGKIVTIRRLKATDYDAMMLFYERFSKGQGAKWTWMFPGRYKNRTQESMTKPWTDTNNLYIVAFDGDKIVGTSSAYKVFQNHPYTGRVATTGTTILEEYTSNGLETKFEQLLEKWALENNVHKFHTEVRQKNIRSLNNLLKNGYEIVGLLHDTAFIDGEWHHEYFLEKILEK